MKPLLDNEQVQKIRDTAKVAFQSLESIGRNNEPFGLLIENASCRAAPQFFSDMGDELFEHSPALALQAYDAGARIQEILNEEETYE